MKRHFSPARLALFGTLAWMSLAFATAQEKDKDKEKEAPKPRVWEKKDREKIEAWESLSPEQREKLREALRGVWTDPAVINAREEVKHASEAYQAAIKAAVEKTDPSVAELLSKVQGAGMMGPMPPGAPGSPGNPAGQGSAGGGPGRGFEPQIRPPGFLDSLTPEARETFRKAEEQALSSESVKAVRAELDQIRQEDEALRRKRIEAHRKLRKVTVDEMIRIDPSIAAMQKRLLEGGRTGAEKKKDGEGKEKKPTEKPTEKPDVTAGKADQKEP